MKISPTKIINLIVICFVLILSSSCNKDSDLLLEAIFEDDIESLSEIQNIQLEGGKISFNEDTTVSINLLDELTSKGNSYKLKRVGRPSYGKSNWRDEKQSIVEIVPHPDFNGNDAIDFTVEVTDENDNITEEDVELEIIVNPVPDVVNDTVVGSINGQIIDVLQNDTFINRDSVSVTSVSSPVHGSVTINENNSLTYLPDSEEVKEDFFEYTASLINVDGRLTTEKGMVIIGLEPNEESEEEPADPPADNTPEDYGTLKAFPSCEGAGCETVTGGRGGSVYHVTNTNNSGAGSLRDALSQPNRIVVFDVAGVFDLSSNLTCKDNITIAGQTAPSGGVTITGYRAYFSNVNNIIVRYVRFRGGADTGASYDSFTASKDITNQIFDHCSFSFGTDENASWYSNDSGNVVDNLTIQRCLFGEGSKGGIVGGTSVTNVGKVSIHHNLYYNQTHRYPNVQSWASANVEVINNVAWTTKNRLIQFGGTGAMNHQGNYYDFGTQPITNNRVHQVGYNSNGASIYTNGNKIVARNTGSPLTNSVNEMNADNKLSFKWFQDNSSGSRGDQVTSNFFVTNAPVLNGNHPINIQTADQAFNSVKSNVGANARITENGTVVDNIDALDAEWLANVNAGIYESIQSSSSWNVPSISVSSSYTDTDRDGMPDAWEISKGLNPNDASDMNSDLDGNGYTNIEEFINLVDF